MPFVLRVVQPKYLSRTSLHDADGGPKIKDDELLAVTNCTLSNALRQLASLVVLANDIFDDLTQRLDEVGTRSKLLKVKIDKVEARVEEYDPKKVTVPEGDLSAFALRKDHFTCNAVLTSDFFTNDTRPKCLRNLYDIAGRTSPDPDGSGGAASGRRSPPLLCTPVLGARQRRLRQKVDVEIETRLPRAIDELRKWTSSEALGDMTVEPRVVTRIAANITLAADEVDLDAGGFSSGDDEPIDHKLPSPEEQIQAIESKFPPQLVPIDTSGRGFDRMCTSRRSLLHVDPSDAHQAGDSQTVRRRTRSRKPRGKRRNTITGTDQKEIRDAIAGDACSPVDEPESPDSGAVIRSHSSDLLKKSPYDAQTKKSHFNTLRQWGRSRLRLINRSPSDNGRDSTKTDKAKVSKSPPIVQDIDDVNIYETVTMRRKKNANGKLQDRKISHERNNSYSSSEKSISMPLSGPVSNAMSLAVKLREVGSNNRRRRINGNGPTKEEPHSSSGNWSASSESGRTSIGSEITSTTAAPRSSTSAATSSNSLNVPHGPPSSIVSRRRFLNTSGSGSVTSEGTLTPDIIHDLHDDMETSSEFSCDTEGYYTSFHMDSGLKTLKEEEISLPITPLHTTSTFSNSSGNQTVLTAESEYELFGKGSTSTTTSSAGTVCTTLLAAGSDRSLVLGPTVPERKSSLSKLNKSRSSSGSSSINLERSYSNSTMGSNSERTGTIKRNTVPKNIRLSHPPESIYKKIEDPDKSITQETVVVIVHETRSPSIINTGAESPDSGHNTSSSPIDDSVSSAHGGKLSCSEMDYSESSDLEGHDRIERIRVKTTINSSRIPSMCVITPNNSDDESVKSSRQDNNDSHNTIPKDNISNRPKLELPPIETDLDNLVFNDEVKNYDDVYNEKEKTPSSIIKANKSVEQKKPNDHNSLLNYVKNKKSSMTRPYKSSLIPLNNLMCRLKEVFPQKKKPPVQKDVDINTSLYTDSGEYVTIADVQNNNQKMNVYNSSGVYYSNDVVKRNLQTVLSGKLHETEYVSLNELPSNITPESITPLKSHITQVPECMNESLKRYGAKVTLDSTGKVIYSSDSLKRRKGAHTTFEPGPFVKENETPTDECDSANLSKTIVVTPKSSYEENHKTSSSRPLSPQLGKVIIRAPGAKSSVPAPTSEFVRMPPSNIVTPTNIVRPMSPRNIIKGAYVNIQDAEGISLSPTKDNNQDYRPLADQPLKRDYVQTPVPTSQFQQPHIAELPSPRRMNPNVSTFAPSNNVMPDSFYWTLQQNKAKNQLDVNYRTLQNKSIGHLDNTKLVENHIAQPINHYRAPMLSGINVNSRLIGNHDVQHSSPKSVNDIKNDSLRMSPINPRSNGSFHASTPTHIENSRGDQVNVANIITSPVKSTMSNEELYAVIHKSKKKMNIKSPPLDRAGSPALSAASLSPGSSEVSIPGRLTPNKLPETGYLTDVRVRHSWSPNFNDNMYATDQRFIENKPESVPRQSNTCSDRLGPPPQTSRLDFKKLLLQHGVKLSLPVSIKQPPKPSAVERLRQSKEAGTLTVPSNQNLSNVNILNLSGSPKTYTHRRVIRSNNANPSSPSRTNILIKENKVTPKILLSPKTQWRFSSPRSDVLSSPIPEVFNEDESPNSSNEKNHEQLLKDFSNVATANQIRPLAQKQGASVKRNLIPVIRENIINDPKNIDISPIHSIPRIMDSTNTNRLYEKPDELLNSGDNSPGRPSRSELLQVQKFQFLSQNSPPADTIPHGFARTFVPSNIHLKNEKRVNGNDVRKCPSPPTLETAL